MAMQITYGKINDKSISIPENGMVINLTETLSELCESFFNEEDLLEDGETITVPTVHFGDMEKLIFKINQETGTLFERIKTTKGSEARGELLTALWDINLLKNVIIEMLLNAEADKYALVIC